MCHSRPTYPLTTPVAPFLSDTRRQQQRFPPWSHRGGQRNHLSHSQLAAYSAHICGFATAWWETQENPVRLSTITPSCSKVAGLVDAQKHCGGLIGRAPCLLVVAHPQTLRQKGVVIRGMEGDLAILEAQSVGKMRIGGMHGRCVPC